jgi:hypothetical protein
MTAEDVAALTEAIVELVREEVPRVATSGRNWKLILHGSATGEVKPVVEEYGRTIRPGKPLQLNT